MPWDPSVLNIGMMIPSSVFMKPSIEVQSIEKSEDLIEGTSSNPGTSAQMFARPSNEVQSVGKLVDLIEETSFEPGPSAQFFSRPSNEVQCVEESVDLIEVTSFEPGTSAQMSTDSLPSTAIPLSSGSPVEGSEQIMKDNLPEFTP